MAGTHHCPIRSLQHELAIETVIDARDHASPNESDDS